MGGEASQLSTSNTTDREPWVIGIATLIDSQEKVKQDWGMLPACPEQPDIAL
jgi:hypothetical protein